MHRGVEPALVHAYVAPTNPTATAEPDAVVIAVLAGPHGDSGFGVHESDRVATGHAVTAFATASAPLPTVGSVTELLDPGSA